MALAPNIQEAPTYDEGLLRAFCDGIRPSPPMSLVEYSEAKIRLPREEAEGGGFYRFSRVPYLREIAECLSEESPVQRIVLKKPGQIGATQLGVNWSAYVAERVPGRMIMIQPTLDMSGRHSNTRIKPMIENTPSVKALIPDVKSSDGTNTTFFKEFPGGCFAIATANSATALSSISARYMHADQIDDYPPDVDNQGPPLHVVDMRSITFGFLAKKYYSGTPTLTDFSAIDALYQESDRRLYYVYCPKCGGEQEILFRDPGTGDRRLVWPYDRPEQAAYECAVCNTLWTEGMRDRAVDDGVWRGAIPWREGMIAGFWLHGALYSKWVTFRMMAREYIERHGDPVKLKTFVNLWLGETWEEKALADIDVQTVYARRESYVAQVPPEVRMLVAGVDIQADRIEFEVIGKSVGEETFSIDYKVLTGDTSGDDVWDALDRWLLAAWDGVDSRQYAIQAVCIDSGYQTQKVYEFCLLRMFRRVWPVKGGKDPHAPIWPKRPTTNNKLRVPLYLINGDAIKDHLFARLAVVPPGPATQHFPDHYDLNYFEQLLSEKPLTIGGKRVWKQKPFTRNEVLDCRKYAEAAWHGLQALGVRAETFQPVAEPAVGTVSSPVEEASAALPSGPSRPQGVGSRREDSLSVRSGAPGQGPRVSSYLHSRRQRG